MYIRKLYLNNKHSEITAFTIAPSQVMSPPPATGARSPAHRQPSNGHRRGRRSGRSAPAAADLSRISACRKSAAALQAAMDTVHIALTAAARAAEQHRPMTARGEARTAAVRAAVHNMLQLDAAAAAARPAATTPAATTAAPAATATAAATAAAEKDAEVQGSKALCSNSGGSIHTACRLGHAGGCTPAQAQTATSGGSGGGSGAAAAAAE